MNESVKILIMIALILAIQQPVFAVRAEDVTGTWQATIYAPDGRQEPGIAVFKQTGNQVTGWVGRIGQDQNPISDGVVKEDKIHCDGTWAERRCTDSGAYCERRRNDRHYLESLRHAGYSEVQAHQIGFRFKHSPQSKLQGIRAVGCLIAPF